MVLPTGERARLRAADPNMRSLRRGTTSADGDEALRLARDGEDSLLFGAATATPARRTFPLRRRPPFSCGEPAAASAVRAERARDPPRSFAKC